MADMTTAVGTKPIELDSEDQKLVFTIPAADGYKPAEIIMAFSQNGSRTMIDVAIDVPEVPMGFNKVLSERKVEQEFEKKLKEWADQYANSANYASTKELQFTLTTVAIAAQKSKIDDMNLAGLYSLEPTLESDGWGEAAQSANYDSDGWGSDSDAADDADGWSTD